jgi:hypothetical protein
MLPVLQIRIRDPVSGAFLTPGSEIRIRDPLWGRNLDPDQEYGLNIPDQFTESLKTVFWAKNT